MSKLAYLMSDPKRSSAVAWKDPTWLLQSDWSPRWLTCVDIAVVCLVKPAAGAAADVEHCPMWEPHHTLMPPNRLSKGVTFISRTWW